ncbi:MAG: aminotransferase class V-fold PLP-dependent enzyme, partial [Verrucomicrobiales bacterium]
SPLNTANMDWTLDNLASDEELRLREFPVARKKIFLAHAAVTALPRAAADAMIDYTRACCEDHQEFTEVFETIKATRAAAAELINAKPQEIALLGPTSLGLSLFANGLPWEQGDEILCYQDDYPANVYPWLELRRRGVKVRYLKVDEPGRLTPESVERQLGAKTKLVALASCHFFTGYRIDIDAIGKLLHARGILFSLDAIQTIGAFDTPVTHVDFLSADAHKWMLGPMSMGIVYVKEQHHELLRPSLLGAWNVISPNFITQEEIRFEPGARRYEPGVLNAVGICGLKASLEQFLALGTTNIENRLLELKDHLLAGLEGAGFEIAPPATGAARSAITTCRRPGADHAALFARLGAEGIVCSHRHNREGADYLRFSHHYYNTEAELDRVLEVIEKF